MTILDRLSPDEVDIMAKERTAELGKANQALSRKNRILEGINKIFNIVVQGKTEEELGNECLSVALEVTGSQLGFVNLMGDDGLRHDIAISDMGWEQCLMYDKTGHLRPPGNFVVHGLYGSVINSEKSLFTNDPMSHSDSIGVPPNLIWKNLEDARDREWDYSSEQQEDLKAIVPAILQALHRKKSE